MNKKQIKKWMQEQLAIDPSRFHAFPKSDEISSTLLAEAAAHHFGHDEWLDDEDNDVWWAALDIVDWWEEEEGVEVDIDMSE